MPGGGVALSRVARRTPSGDTGRRSRAPISPAMTVAMAMAIAMNDDKIPVLVGCGQITQRQPDLRAALAPLALMAQATGLAADNSGASAALLQALGTAAVIRLFADTSPRFACPFGRYTKPPLTLAHSLGAGQVRRHIYTHPGGNMPGAQRRPVQHLCAGLSTIALRATAHPLPQETLDETQPRTSRPVRP